MDKIIDLNCDLGEWKDKDGALKDESIMPYISSCNIACGGHIGDLNSMKTTISLAQKYGVAVGVHPSYPDRENFGRKVMDIPAKELEDILFDQISEFKSLVVEEGAGLHHVKPHGALYNQAAKDKATASAIISAVKRVDKSLPVYLPPGSVSEQMALESGLQVVQEVFADRAYEDDLTLMSRDKEGSVLHNISDVLAQLRSMVIGEKVLTASGCYKPIKARSVCLHSDTPGSVKLAENIYNYLKDYGVEIAAP